MKVTFPPRGLPGTALEGELMDGGGAPCVVSHPHPLAGGDMRHPVPRALWRAAGDAGLKALRYNFRGVGASGGEITGDVHTAAADLAGAIDFLGGGPVLAIGYSHGARATLHALHQDAPIERAALVALPMRLPASFHAMSNLLLGRPIRPDDFSDTADLALVDGVAAPVRIFCGSLDPLVDREKLEAHGLAPVVLEGVNHFYSRRLGNQPPDKGDLESLCSAVLAFLVP